MNRKLPFILLALLLMSSGCSNNESQPAPAQAPNQTSRQTPQTQPTSILRTVSPVEAQQLISSRKDLLLIDVRNQNELSQGAIAGSQLLPFWNIMKNNHSIPKDRPLLLICAVGGRSYGAGQILSRQGYPEIYNLKGGIDAWKRAGLPLQY